jgi:hypothetical protein
VSDIPFIIIPDFAIGDSIVAMGVAQQLAARYPKIHLLSRCVAIEHCMRPPNSSEYDQTSATTGVYYLSVEHSHDRTRGIMADHPSVQLQRKCGLPTAGLVRPWFAPQNPAEAIPVPQYEYVIAPFSAAKERTMPDELLKRLTEELYTAYSDNIAIIGSDQDRKRPVMNQLYGNILCGYSFSFILELMHVARTVITVDSAPSRLAFCTYRHDTPLLRNHIIVAPPMFLTHWVGYPGADVVQEWSVDAIIAKVKL